MSTIMTLDGNLLLGGKRSERNVFVQQLQEAFTTTGFFLLKNHKIDPNLLKDSKELFEKFFHLPTEQRMKYVYPDIYYQKGYTPMNIETGQFAKDPDYKHFYQIGDTYENPFVNEVPGLSEVTKKMFGEFYGLYNSLMYAVAVSLEIPWGKFEKELGNSIMRFIHYPAHAMPMVDDGAVTQGGNLLGMCASRHTDINDLTLLYATEPGLELRYKNKWIPVLCDPDTIIVNVGDMLWHLTGGIYKSGEHRVVCEPNKDRFSCPFFGHRIDAASVKPLKKFNGLYKPENFPWNNEGEFLHHRLQEINLKH